MDEYSKARLALAARAETVSITPVYALPDGRMNRENAAAYLGVQPKTLAMWAMEGKGPGYIRIGRRVFYFKTELDRFIREQGT